MLGAAASRQNAAPIIVALAVPSIVLLGRRWLAGRRRWVSAVIVLVTSLAVGVGALLVVRVAQSTMGVRSTNPGAALQAYDTAAISLRSGEIYLDPVTFPAQDLDVLQNSFKPGSGINLYTGSPPVLSFPSTGVPDDQAARITHDWRRAVTDHPGEYLSARSDFWLRLVGLRSTTPWYVVHPSGIDGNGLGFELHNQRGDDAARRYLGLFADAPDFNTGGWLFKPWLYMLMAAGVGAWLLRRHRREVGAQVMAALAIGSILYEVTFFLAGVSAYYRYSYPTVVWALLAGAYAAVLGVGDRRARRAAHQPAPGSRVVHYGVLTAGAAILVIVMVGVVTNVPTLADSAVSPGMYVVTTGAGDTSVAGSLPWAVAQANSHRGVDYVRFGAAVTDIAIDAPLVVTGMLSIDGQRYGELRRATHRRRAGLDRLIVLTASAPGSSINHLHLAGFRQSAIEVQAGASGGFLVGNTVEVGSGAAAMSVAAERIGILNNVVTGAGTGVHLKAGARGNGMSGNTITLCGTGTVGVRAVDSAYNYIGSRNTISAESGVVVKGAGSLGNAVTNNQFDAVAGSCATPSTSACRSGTGRPATASPATRSRRGSAPTSGWRHRRARRSVATPPKVGRRRPRSVPLRSASPAPVDPLLEVRALGADRRVDAVAGQHDRVVGEREQALSSIESMIVGEVAAGELGGAGTAGEQACRR